jgi:hypothetical protein
MGPRDLIWAVLICLGLNYYLHTRPLGQARSFMERESLEGFRRAFIGHKFLTGELIMPQAGGKVFEDTHSSPVNTRQLDVQAEELAWDGRRAEFVVRHLVTVVDGTPEGTDVGHQVHVTLEKDGGDWHYGQFQVLGQPAQALGDGNPWEAALAAAATR